MKTFKIGFFLFGLLFLLACGDTPGADQPSAADAAVASEATAVAVSSNAATTKEELAPANNQLKEAEEALKEEVIESPSESEEKLEMDYQNIENPQPKKKLVIEPLKPAEKNVEVEESLAQNTISTTNSSVEEPKSNESPITEKEIIPATPKEDKPSAITDDDANISDFNHDMLNNLLVKHVSSSGKVDYKSFKTDESKLDTYLKTLEDTPLSSSWSRAKQMAYYINAYNAATIKLILKNWPVKSITDLHGGKPWDVKWVKLGGKTYSLNAIENDILRPKYNDARIHFAVNCAAKSCPPLLNKAWTESNLNQLLDQQARLFINNVSYNLLSVNSVEISKIFDWYAADFGDITDYLNKYTKTEINDNAKVTYKEYNWALNN
jgi:hypothetical protein